VQVFDKPIKGKGVAFLPNATPVSLGRARWENHRQTLFARLTSDGFVV
jgi:hypothetical protein